MLFKRQRIDWLLLLLITTGLFIYASYQPQFRLRSSMPPEFVDMPSSASAQQRSAEEKVARVYWSCMVDNIQWRYGYGRTLPINIPPDFAMTVEPPAVALEDPATRTRYWRRAQHVWSLPNMWTKEYEWDFNWTTNWIETGGDWLHTAFQHLGGS